MSFSDLTSGVLAACTAAFGESVTYTPQGSSAETITGIFNLRTELADLGSGVLSYQPTLGVKLSDLSVAPRVGDTVSVRSVSYKVRDIDEDGEGGATILLHKAT
jgi:hypothetical protein